MTFYTRILYIIFSSTLKHERLVLFLEKHVEANMFHKETIYKETIVNTVYLQLQAFSKMLSRNRTTVIRKIVTVTLIK